MRIFAGLPPRPAGERLTRRVALLRAVNVGGAGKIVMSDLRKVAEAAGFENAATILQSGSLVFSGSGTREDLERRLEAMLAVRCGLATAAMVRSAADWSRIIAGNPFADMAERDPSRLLAFILKGPTHVAEAPAIDGPERVHVAGDVLYVGYPAAIGRSKLTGARLERYFGVRGTGRNWSTVLKIATALAD